MSRCRTINERNTKATIKSKGSGKKFREKTLHEHGLDCLHHILKKLSVEDKVKYFCCKAPTPVDEAGQEDYDKNQVDVMGSEASFRVSGRAYIGLWYGEGKYWKGADGASGHEISYACDAKVVLDELGQKRVEVGEFTVDGMDECPVQV